MDLPDLVAQYGYLAVVVGTFLEGETVLALAGVAAHLGYLDFATVTAIAAAAGFAGDQFWFHLGRLHGARILARFPSAQARAHRFDELVARWHAPLIVMVRFMYGFRILGPILFGMGRVRAPKFMAYNAIGAVLWAPLVAGAGWLSRHAIEAMLRSLHAWQSWLVAAAAAVALAAILARRVMRRRGERAPPD